MHQVVTLSILLKSYNHYYIKNTMLHLSKTLQRRNVPLIDFKYISLPHRKKNITLLKSPHVHKKAREQFSLSTKKGVLEMKTRSQRDALWIMWLINYSIFPGIQAKLHIRYLSKS